MRGRGTSFKQSLDSVIRVGLAWARRRCGRRFIQKSSSLGSEQYFRWDKALSIAVAIEDDEVSL
jgi:hypothetical protein